MTPLQFFSDLQDEWFPHTLGPWVNFNQFDPPFKREELREMRREGILVLDEKGKRFRLTLKATEMAGKTND